MSKRLIIICSGRKQAGKSSLCKYIFTEYINKKIGKTRFKLEQVGKEVNIYDSFNNNKIIRVDYPSNESKHFADTYGIKIYSFADPLKSFCINVLGLDFAQCYGSDDDKNSPTHLLWEDLPLDIRQKNAKIKKSTGEERLPTGHMTGRNVMEVFGTDVCRRLDPNCWSRGSYAQIDNDGYDVSILQDGRFPNEITMGSENGAKSIRLLKRIDHSEAEAECALDHFPHGEFTKVVDNQNLTMQETHNLLKQNIFDWFAGYRLV
jgi:hypothetical protein